MQDTWKGLGGSSSMNAMLYVRGRPLDYDLWEKQGAAGWGWRDVLPYFLRSEDNARGASEFHAAGGPLRVEEQRSPRASRSGRSRPSRSVSGAARISSPRAGSRRTSAASIASSPSPRPSSPRRATRRWRRHG